MNQGLVVEASRLKVYWAHCLSEVGGSLLKHVTVNSRYNDVR